MTAGPRLAASFPEGAVLGECLVAAGLTVGVAESCTGGLLGAVLTAVPGASRYMRGGIIAYADAVKVNHLAVEPELIERVGTVSPEVAAAMAQGVAQRLGTSLGIAITGVAGPGSEGTAKPVGLTYVAAWLDGRTEVVELRASGDREANRDAAVRKALTLGLRLAGCRPPAPAATG